MHKIKLILISSLLFSSANIAGSHNFALIEQLFNVITTNSYAQLCSILNNPGEFSRPFGCNYTAEQLCNLPNKYGRTSLHAAALSPKVTQDTTTLLIEHGANPDAQDAQGLTPLHIPQNLSVARTLIQFGAKTDISANLLPDTPHDLATGLLLSDVEENRKELRYLSIEERKATINDWPIAQRVTILAQAQTYQADHKQEIAVRRKKIDHVVGQKQTIHFIQEKMSNLASQAITDSLATIASMSAPRK